MQPPAAHRTLRFGVFEVDLRAGELRKNGLKVRLQERPLQILAVLLERPGEMVTRQDLQRRLWPAHTFVDFDHSLGTAVGRLRQALGDSAQNPRFVETLGNRGYRFIASVSSLSDTSNLPRESDSSVTQPGVKQPQPLGRKGTSWWLSGWLRGAVALTVALAAILIALKVSGWGDRIKDRGRPAEIGSLAVLPFENLTHDPAQEYYADGMTEELITSLGKIGALRVISRTSVMPYKGTREPLSKITRELNVDGVVEGSVLRSGEHVRITAQLVRANPERHLWAESYERDARDSLALQQIVARDIADAIRIKLTPQEQSRLSGTYPVDPEALDAYLRGVYCWNSRTEESLEKSIEYFNLAIQREPRYALAYAGLANSYNTQILYEYVAPRETYPKVNAALLKALELDDSLAEAHAVLGHYKAAYEWDEQAAEREFRRAIELNPGYAFAHIWLGEVLTDMDRYPEALAEVDRAGQLDPTSLIVSDQRGWVLYMARRYDEAAAQIRKTIELDPHFAHAHCWLGKAYLQKGMLREGLAELEEAASLSGGDTQLYGRWLGYAYALSGKRAEAYNVIDELRSQPQKRFVSASGIALIYCGLHENGQALDWLDKAYQQRDPLLLDVKNEPAFDPLRSEPRFRAVLRRTNPRL
jgi:TolB-like protein/DNA-binding winged helix-turn-helix (wHTH) protein/Tfp pilus assembly protein PilF